jgi:hypothetical protein
MAERQQADYWIDFGDEGAPRSIRDSARRHENHRQRVVALIFLELYLMAATEIIPKTAKGFTLIKARSHDAFGSDNTGTEATHCVPRQLVIRARDPHDLLRKVLPDRAEFVRGFFEKTDTLPIDFNKCDSRCEQLGLVEGFRIGCVSAISSGHSSIGKIQLAKVTVDIKNAFDLYKSAAKDSVQASVTWLEKKLTFPKPLPENERKWKKQLIITQGYAHEIRYSSAIRTISDLDEFEHLIKIYEKV